MKNSLTGGTHSTTCGHTRMHSLYAEKACLETVLVPPSSRMPPVCLGSFHNPFRTDGFLAECSANASRTGQLSHSGAPEKHILSMPKIIFERTEYSYRLPEHSSNITSPTIIELEPKTNVKRITRETFGTSYLSV